METRLDEHTAVKVGDLTLEDVDAIVNAANASLLGGGGVDGAIHRAGGPAILAECRELRRKRYPHGLQTGDAVITGGGNLRARHVIHTVGPVYGQNGGRDAALLAACYEKSIAIAAAHGLVSIAFPAISTGVYRYPKDEAARIATGAIRRALQAHPAVRDVRLVMFSANDAKVFLAAARS